MALLTCEGKQRRQCGATVVLGSATARSCSRGRAALMRDCGTFILGNCILIVPAFD
jgi:hypothetical protein